MVRTPIDEKYEKKMLLLYDLIGHPEKLENKPASKLLEELSELNNKFINNLRGCDISGLDINIINAESILIELSKRKLSIRTQKKLNNLRKRHQGYIHQFHIHCICTYDEDTKEIIKFSQELKQLKLEEEEAYKDLEKWV